MRVDDIRPEELVRENLALYAKDVERLMERSGEFEILFACPACRKGAYEVAQSVVFTKDGFIHKICSSCGTVFISPRPNRALLLKYYSEAESIKHWATKLFPATVAQRREHVFAPRAWEVRRVCEREGLAPKIVLDVGAGYGTFCEELIKLLPDTHVVAVEPSPYLALHCRLSGLAVMMTSIEGMDLNQEVDVVTAFELLEHLFDPHDLVEAARRVLVPGGLLYVTTPNVDGFELATVGSASENFGGPNHLQLLTPCALRVLLEAHGFEVLDLDTPGELDASIVRMEALRCHVDLSRQPFLRTVLVDRWEELGSDFQAFIAEHGLSSHMRAVARKR